MLAPALILAASIALVVVAAVVLVRSTEEHPLLAHMRAAPISKRPLTPKQLADLERTFASPDWVSGEEVMADIARRERHAKWRAAIAANAIDPRPRVTLEEYDAKRAARRRAKGGN